MPQCHSLIWLDRTLPPIQVKNDWVDVYVSCQENHSSTNMSHPWCACVRFLDKNHSALSWLRRAAFHNGNIFRVTGHLCGEFTGYWWIPPNKGQWRGALMFSLICARISGCLNNREAGDLRRHSLLWNKLNLSTAMYERLEFIYDCSRRILCPEILPDSVRATFHYDMMFHMVKHGDIHSLLWFWTGANSVVRYM